MCASGDSKFSPLCVSVNDHESTASVDFRITNKFWPVGELANTASVSDED